MIYEANREQITDPERIYPGQVFSMPSMPGTATTPPTPGLLPVDNTRQFLL